MEHISSYYPGVGWSFLAVITDLRPPSTCDRCFFFSATEFFSSLNLIIGRADDLSARPIIFQLTDKLSVGPKINQLSRKFISAAKNLSAQPKIEHFSSSSVRHSFLIIIFWRSNILVTFPLFFLTFHILKSQCFRLPHIVPDSYDPFDNRR